MSEHPKKDNWRDKIHEIIFEADTPLGKLFDEFLIISILASVLVVMLDSVTWIRKDHEGLLYALEWFFTILFSVEYILRLISVKRPAKYATSFFGIVDFPLKLPISTITPLDGPDFANE